MQLVDDGPDIPQELLAAQEEGDLVLFCGAGVSMRAGLPGFRELTERLYRDCGPSRPLQPCSPLDREMHLLEQQVPRKVIVAKIHEHLRQAPDPTIDTHEAIVGLSADADGTSRLVTTNFDTLFERAAPTLEVHAAPLLPVPKRRKWKGLVYLHGRMNPGEDPEGLKLVFTSANFGVAYLVEGWARRFVLELFRQYTILFTGYSAQDPVLRYLLDALAAERLFDRSIRQSFAFVVSADANAMSAWVASGVRPIPYDSDDHHAVLHTTLHKWAGLMRGGLSPRRTLLRSLASSRPEALAPFQVEQMRWLLAEDSATLAREFAGLGRSAPASWLRHLAPDGRLSVRSKPESSPDPPVVDGGFRAGSPQPLSRHGWALARWLQSHLESVDAIEWVVERGGILHPEIRESIARAVAGPTGPASPFREAWGLLVSETIAHSHGSRFDFHVLVERLKTETWSSSLRLALLRALAPLVRVAPSHRLRLAPAPRRVTAMRDLLDAECVLACDGLQQQILEALESRADRPTVLRDIAYAVTEILRQASELWTRCEKGDLLSWMNEMHLRTLHEDDEEAVRYHSWTLLVRIAREALLATRKTSGANALALVSHWLSIRHVALRRLAAFAASRFKDIGHAVWAHISLRPHDWLWGVLPSHEEVKLLRALARRMSESDRGELVAIIARGPRRSRRARREGAANPEHRALEVWVRLRLLRRIGSGLDPRSLRLLKRLESRHPEWKAVPRRTITKARPRPQAVWRGASQALVAETLNRRAQELADALAHIDAAPEDFLDAWQQAAAGRPARALCTLSLLLRRGHLDVRTWSAGLTGLRKVPRSATFRRLLMAVLQGLPISAKATLASEISAVLSAASEGITDAEMPLALAIWDELLPLTAGVRPLVHDDSVLVAINHPCGILAEALLKMLFVEPRAARSGLPSEFQERLGILASAPAAEYRWARLLLASRLHPLHVVDPDWARRYLLPMFDWAVSSHAREAWQAYLWAPQLYPALWRDLKPHFLAACDHYLEFDREWRRPLPQIVAELAMQVDGALAVDESKRCLSGLDDEGRAEVARRLAGILRAADARADTLWAERAGPWLREAWPKTRETQGPHASAALASAAMAAGSSFPNAIETILGYLVPIDPQGLFYGEVSGSHVAGAFPGACLQLLDAVTPVTAEAWKLRGLGSVLGEISAAAPELRQRPAFVRLGKLAEQSGQDYSDGERTTTV